MNLILAGLTTYRGRVSTLKRCSRYFSKKKGSFITLIYPYKDMFSPKYEHYSSPQILIVTYPPFFRSKLIFQAKIFECQQHFVFRSKRVWSPHGDKALNSPFSAGQYFHWELNICFVLVNPCEKIYFFPWWFFWSGETQLTLASDSTHLKVFLQHILGTLRLQPTL